MGFDSAELAIQERLSQRDWSTAAALALDSYGAEIQNFLFSTHASADDAKEVFAQLWECVMAGLPGFRGESSMRTWLYVIARHCSQRFKKLTTRKRNEVRFSQISSLPLPIRTATAECFKTDKRHLVQALRDALSEEDRQLLFLRVDQNMDWRDVARVMSPTKNPSQSELTRKSVALRKRFERVKNALQRAAIERGFCER